MKYLTTYKIFESSQDYGIYDWIEDLKRHDWSHPQNQTVDESSLKKWSDHFIGEGWYDKVNSLVGKIFQSIDKVDVNYINDRMFDVYDIIPSGKEKYTICCITYGDVENWDKPNNRKYNGLLSVRETDNKAKIRIIIHIYNQNSSKVQPNNTNDFLPLPNFIILLILVLNICRNQRYLTTYL